jgi:hypothetical protein
MTLRWTSYFRTTYLLSVRKSDIKKLSDSIRWMGKGSYFVVTGGNGNEKSCLIDTALNRQPGVVKLSVRFRLIFVKADGSARRLLFFYSFLFKITPIVVLSLPERQSGEPYDQVTAAVRALTDDYGLRVVVDGSPNSIPPELLTTKRQTVISVELMLKEEIEFIPEIKGLIDFLKSHNLDGPVRIVLGGSPPDYLKLNDVANAKMLFLPTTASDEAVGEVK